MVSQFTFKSAELELVSAKAASADENFASPFRDTINITVIMTFGHADDTVDFEFMATVRSKSSEIVRIGVGFDRRLHDLGAAIGALAGVSYDSESDDDVSEIVDFENEIGAEFVGKTIG